MDVLAAIFDWPANILGGTIGNLLLGAFQVIINLICGLLIGCLGTVGEVFLKAMAVKPDEIDNWLGTALTTGSFAETITISGMLIAALFAMWELCRGLMAFIQGENSPMRPGVILIRFIIFGSWTYAGIRFSKIIFGIGSKIYDAVPFNRLSYGLAETIWTMFSSAVVSIGTYITSSFAALFGAYSWAAELLGHVMATALIIFSMIGFLKLLFTCSQRYVNMIFYTYFSPLAIACGVSSSWSKITWTWLKTMLSTLVLWVLDIWCIFGGYNLLQAGLGALSNQNDLIGALSCMLVTYGFMKGAIAFDGIMSQFGATVTKTTGSLMGDVRDMMVMSHAASSIGKTLSGISSGVNSALTQGSGVGNAGKYSNLKMDKWNNGKARSAAETARDVAVAALAGTATGRAALSTINGAIGLSKRGLQAWNEHRNSKRGNDMFNMAKGLGANVDKYRGKGAGKTTGNLPNPKTPEGKAYNEGLQDVIDKFGEKGIGMDDLANDPNVMDKLSGATLFDPQHPELGTMADNGFQCVGYNPGRNGVGKAMFDKRDQNGNLLERREASHLRYGDVGQTAGTGKKLANGMVAGSPAQTQKLFSGDIKSTKITPTNQGNGYNITGVDQNGHAINKSINTTSGKNLDNSQPVLVTTRNSEGTPISQDEYTLKSGKSLRDAADAIASGNLDSAFVTKKNKNGVAEPVVTAHNSMNDTPRASSNTYAPLSNDNGPLTFSKNTMGDAVKQGNIKSGGYVVSASQPDENGMVSLAAVAKNDPTTVVARGSISASDLEEAYHGNRESMNAAIHNAFNPPVQESSSDSTADGPTPAPHDDTAPAPRAEATTAPTPDEQPTPRAEATTAPTPDEQPTPRAEATTAPTPDEQPAPRAEATTAPTPDEQPAPRAEATTAPTPDEQPAPRAEATTAPTPDEQPAPRGGIAQPAEVAAQVVTGNNPEPVAQGTVTEIVQTTGGEAKESSPKAQESTVIQQTTVQSNGDNAGQSDTSKGESHTESHTTSSDSHEKKRDLLDMFESGTDEQNPTDKAAEESDAAAQQARKAARDKKEKASKKYRNRWVGHNPYQN